jgi:putative protease
MKGEQYVKTTTSIYRKYLDQALQGKFKGIDKKDLDLLWLAYNREFTKGYLFDSRFAQVKSRLRPDNRGLLLGNVISIDNRKETMTVRPVTDIVPNNKDVIKVVTDHDYRIKNLNLHVKHIKTDSQGNLVMNSHKDAAKGDQVYLATHNIGGYLDPKERGIVVEVKAHIKMGEPVRMTAKGGGMDAEATGTQEVSRAKTSPLTKESVLKQVLKTAPYQVRIKDVSVQMDEDCFVTISELNTVRRALYEKVENGWLKTKYPLPKRLKIDMRRALGGLKWGKKRKGPGKRVSRLCAITNDIRDIEMLRNGGLDCIYLDCLYGLSNDKNVEKALSSIKRFGKGDLFIKTPRISMPWELKALEGFLKKLDPKTEFGGFRAGNWGAYRIIRSVFPKAEVHADMSFNVTNFVSADMLLDDFQRITLSPEMEAYDMVDLARSCKRPSGLDILAGGRHPIMVTRDCLLGSSYENATTGPKGFTDKRCKRSCTEGFWFLKDYKKRHYPLWMDPECFGHLFNHKVLETDLKLLNKARLSSFTVDLRGFPGNERAKALNDFRQVLKGGGGGRG